MTDKPKPIEPITWDAPFIGKEKTDELYDLIENLTAALENVMAHWSELMAPADVIGRTSLVTDAKRVLAKRHPPMTDEEFVAEVGGLCPICRSDRIELGYDPHPSMIEGAAYQNWHCKTCGNVWMTEYKLVGWLSLGPLFKRD